MLDRQQAAAGLELSVLYRIHNRVQARTMTVLADGPARAGHVPLCCWSALLWMMRRRRRMR